MADQIENTETEETPEPSLDDAINGAFDVQEPEEEQLEATEEEPEAEDGAEATEEPEGEGAEEEAVEDEEELDMGQVIGNAANIALDPEHELYEDAVAVLQEYAPELAERLGLGASEEGEEVEALEEDEPENDAIAELQAQLDEMRNAQAERDRQIEQEQQAAEDAAAQEAFRADLVAIAGEDTPEAFAEMNPSQQLAAAALLGLDGLADDPKEAFQTMMKDRDAAMIQSAIDDYAAGKGTVKPTPPTDRNASTSTHSPVSISEIVSAATKSENGVSG